MILVQIFNLTTVLKLAISLEEIKVRSVQINEHWTIYSRDPESVPQVWDKHQLDITSCLPEATGCPWGGKRFKIEGNLIVNLGFSPSQSCVGESMFSTKQGWSQSHSYEHTVCIYELGVWMCLVSLWKPLLEVGTCCASPSCLRLASVPPSAWQAAAAWLKFILYFPSGERTWKTPAVLAETN